MINADQIRAARALLRWSIEKLSQETSVSRPTIQRMETRGTGSSSMDNVNAIRAALESAGVEFIPGNGGGPGVRLREREG